MEEYQFYSKKKGWNDKLYTAKYYVSSIIKLDKKIGNKLIGLTGNQIIECKIEIKELNELSKKWNNWYFYEIKTHIGYSTEIYI
tara:strand:- start:634 stop:885 length:252 start_codon:yes stop_codon:yes gene_type:complete